MYEGDLKVDDQLVTDLIGVCRVVATRVNAPKLPE